MDVSILSANIAALVIIDPQCRVKYVSTASLNDRYMRELLLERGTHLQPDVETAVRELLGAEESASELPRVAFMRDEFILRLAPLSGIDGRLFALTLEPDRNGGSLSRAARRFQLTRRESEVLSLILEGHSAGEIASILVISENTVQGYFKRLLSKTGSRNRPAMVANVLEWDRRPRPASASVKTLRGHEDPAPDAGPASPHTMQPAISRGSA